MLTWSKLKIDNTKRKIKKTLDSHRERQRRQHERLADAANNSKNEDSDDVEDHEEQGKDKHQARFLQASPQDAQKTWEQLRSKKERGIKGWQIERGKEKQPTNDSANDEENPLS